jgi:predicted lysophospholipase L1 biosynthesis ABC-type transport system permease subunit
MFPAGGALGRQLTRAGSDEVLTVLGVVGDVLHGGPMGKTAGYVYLPFRPNEDTLRSAEAMTYVLRVSDPPPDLAERLRRTALGIGPRTLVEQIRTGDAWFADRVLTPRRRTVLLSLLGALGLTLAIVGVFGMTAYAVTRRTREIGVRMVFGARPGEVVGRMVRDSAMPILLGTLAGLGGAAAATRAITSFLFETDPLDPGTFAAVAVVLVTTGLLAAWIPARRAARVDPIAALRSE